METVFEVEWEAIYLSASRRVCKIRTKEEIFRNSQFKQDGNLLKNAKKKKANILESLPAVLAIHLVLAHNAMVRGHTQDDAMEQIIKEHIDIKTEDIKQDIMYYMGLTPR